MSSIYNPQKLPPNRSLYRRVKVLVVGSGAVGTCLMEFLAKMGLSEDAVDFDRFTLENAAKHSCLVRTPEDAGRSKAPCVAQRVQPLLEEGCSANGVDADLRMLGPEAFADYDYVASALDNYPAKVLLNEQLRQLPEQRRPILIMGGTNLEMAQSVILDQKEFCLRCLIGEEWLVDAADRNSCSGPQLLDVGGVPQIVETSNLASSMCAHLMAEQLRGHRTGAKGVMNRRLTYTAYPNIGLNVTWPVAKSNCPGCRIHPPAEVRWLPGTLLQVTLEEAMKQIEENLGSGDFEILCHQLNYRELVRSGFIVDDVCHCCGKPISVLRHEGRTFPEDLRCPDCASKPAKRQMETSGRILRAFTRETDPAIRKMTMYDLGYPLGAHIQVVQRNGAQDFRDREKIVTTVFAFAEDHTQLHKIQTLS